MNNLEERILEIKRRIELIEENLSELIDWRNSVSYIDCELVGDGIKFKIDEKHNPTECPFCKSKIETKSDEECLCSEKN